MQTWDIWFNKKIFKGFPYMSPYVKHEDDRAGPF